MPAKEYWPSSFETVVNSLPVARFFREIRALGQTICVWLGSREKMVPERRVVSARRGVAIRSRRQSRCRPGRRIGMMVQEVGCRGRKGRWRGRRKKGGKVQRREL